ncbi:hypothetical protein [Flavobacterium sp.]|uniref:hypothetical protein n=1 Tax=Flavobacterium sp. TaxID=239 RepID=UPI0039E62B24
MKGFFFQAALLFLVFASAAIVQGQNGAIIHQTSDYTIFSDGVKQGAFSAKAVSSTELVSNYQSPKNESVSSLVEFKFSINQKDNEMKPGLNHWFNLSGKTETPLIQFGQPLTMTDKNETSIPSDTPLKVRLDLRPVLAEIKSKGYFTTFNGDRIFKADFKHVYIAGATAPLTWDFDNLHQKPELEMKDPDGDGIYETKLVFNSKKDQKTTDGNWKMTRNTTAFPQYQSDHVLADAIYNLSLERNDQRRRTRRHFPYRERMGGRVDTRHQLQHHLVDGLLATAGGDEQFDAQGQRKQANHPGYGNRRRLSVFNRPCDLGHGSLGSLQGDG